MTCTCSSAEMIENIVSNLTSTQISDFFKNLIGDTGFFSVINDQDKVDEIIEHFCEGFDDNTSFTWDAAAVGNMMSKVMGKASDLDEKLLALYNTISSQDLIQMGRDFLQDKIDEFDAETITGNSFVSKISTIISMLMFVNNIKAKIDSVRSAL